MKKLAIATFLTIIALALTAGLWLYITSTPDLTLEARQEAFGLWGLALCFLAFWGGIALAD